MSPIVVVVVISVVSVVVKSPLISAAGRLRARREARAPHMRRRTKLPYVGDCAPEVELFIPGAWGAMMAPRPRAADVGHTSATERRRPAERLKGICLMKAD